MGFQEKVRESFAKQKYMGFIGASLSKVEPGFCEIILPYKEELTQQNGFIHAGIIGALADNVGGYAAYSLMKEGESVLTIEYKLNLLAPAKDGTLVARSKVAKAGKTITVCHSDVFVVKDSIEMLCATAIVTLMALKDYKH